MRARSLPESRGTSVSRSAEHVQRAPPAHTTRLLSGKSCSPSPSTGRHRSVRGCASVLEVRDLTYRPASLSRPLLNDVSFDLSPGRIGLIYGPSGSGKSTLLNVLAGFSNSYDGEIVLQSSSPRSQSPPVRDFGVVFQFPERYFVGNTIMDELSFGWRHSNRLDVRSEFVTRLQSVLKIAGLSHLPLDKNLTELSGGYQRRVAIAVQLLRMPSVLLLDEPTAGMDLPSINALCDTLETVKRKSAVLVVSHDLGMLSKIADDVWEMKAGGRLVRQ